MKSFASLAVLLSMAYTATAVAIPEVEAVTDVALAKRQDNGAWCGKRVNGGSSYYEITTWGYVLSPVPCSSLLSLVSLYTHCSFSSLHPPSPL